MLVPVVLVVGLLAAVPAPAIVRDRSFVAKAAVVVVAVALQQLMLVGALLGGQHFPAIALGERWVGTRVLVRGSALERPLLCVCVCVRACVRVCVKVVLFGFSILGGPSGLTVAAKAAEKVRTERVAARGEARVVRAVLHERLRALERREHPLGRPRAKCGHDLECLAPGGE